MVFFVLAIICLIVGVILLLTRDKEKSEWTETSNKIKTIISVIAIIVAVIFLLMSFIGVVPTGYTGILTTFGAVEDRTLSPGINFTLPWQKVITMDNRTQKEQLQVSAFSSDIQQVDIIMSINYCIDQTTARELYKTVGTHYFENIMYPRILEHTKSVFSQYTAENLVSQRETLSISIADLMKENMSAYGIQIVSIAIEDIDFTDAFTNAVEAKQVAAQNKLTAETQQAQKAMEQEAEAERAIIAANAKAEQDIIAAKADLEVVKIQADAALYAGEREANMNERIAAALTDELINYYWIKQWDGVLPSTVLGSENSFMIDLTD